jgi:4-amino-4-deoxy-L-arabinose transferase-like glycosyltransferase
VTAWARRHAPLGAIVLAALAVRLVILPATADTGLKIVDEQHYHQLATNLSAGHGFGWAPGDLTSIRPPLYPVFVATVWRIAGQQSLPAVRLAQIFLSLATVLLLHRLARRILRGRAALVAAALFAFYPSFIVYDYLLLTEVLFTFLLTAFVTVYAEAIHTGRPSRVLLAGALLGFASLTRSVLWPFPVILAPLAFLSMRGSAARRLGGVALLVVGFAGVVGPWAVRNTLLQGTFTVVDTMGGLTLHQGNYAHTPLERPWDAISLEGERSWAYELRRDHPDVPSWTEGQKDRWARRRAIAYMTANPGITLLRAVVKFADFWGLEREYIAAMQRGLYGPPAWFRAVTTLTIVASYVAIMALACLGLFLAPPADRRVHWCVLAVIGFICAVHSVIYGHSRYHLPLVPLLILYAAAALTRRSWLHLGEGRAWVGPAVTAAVLVSVWGRELLLRDFERVRMVIRSLL